jgi:hypothetical protein
VAGWVTQPGSTTTLGVAIKPAIGDAPGDALGDASITARGEGKKGDTLGRANGAAIGEPVGVAASVAQGVPASLTMMAVEVARSAPGVAVWAVVQARPKRARPATRSTATRMRGMAGASGGQDWRPPQRRPDERPRGRSVAAGWSRRRSIAPAPLGIAWLAVTALAMFGLAWGKRLAGHQLGNPVLTKEAKTNASMARLLTKRVGGHCVCVTSRMKPLLRWEPADMTAVFAVVGERRDDPLELLLLGADGQHYAYPVPDGPMTPVEPNEEWQLDQARPVVEDCIA